MPAVERLCGPSAVTSAPLKRIVPAPGARSPAIRLNSVVFPAPFGPMMPSASPCMTSRSIASAALTEPKERVRPLSSRRFMRRRPHPGLPPLRGGRRSNTSPRLRGKVGWGCRRARAVRRLSDRLHLPARRNVRRRLVVGDDDVVLAAVLEPPLAADERRARYVGARERRHVLLVPLHRADDGLEV